MTTRLSRAAPLLCSFLLAVTRAAAIDPVIVGPQIGLPGMPEAVAYDGAGNFLAVWACGTAICGARVEAASGLVEAHELVTTVGRPWYVRLAFDGAKFLLVWQETRERGDIYAARVSPSGVCLDPGGFVVSQDLPAFDGYFERLGRYGPAVGFDGTTFVVYWIERFDWELSAVYGARVSLDGEVLDPAGTAVTNPWETNGLDLYGLVVEQGVVAYVVGSWLGTRVVSTWGGVGFRDMDVYVGSPDLSMGDSSTLTVVTVEDPYWLLATGGGIFGSLGGPAGQGRIQLSTGGAMPLAAWEGTSHLVLWSEGASSVGVRLPASGAVAETREVCLTDWPICLRLPVTELEVPGNAWALASNGRGVSLATTLDGSAYLLTSSFAPAVADGLAAADAAVVALPDADFKNVNMRAALRNKLGSIANLVKGKDYPEALTALKDLQAKTDGCALRFAPDADDWIKSCAAQRRPFATVEQIEVVVAFEQAKKGSP